MRKLVSLLANEHSSALPAQFDTSQNLVDETIDWGKMEMKRSRMRGQSQDNSIACTEKDRKVLGQNEAPDVLATDHWNNEKDFLFGLIDDEMNYWPFSQSKLLFDNSGNHKNCSTQARAYPKSAKKSIGFHRRRKTCNHHNNRVICKNLDVFAGKISPFIPLNAERSCSGRVKETSKKNGTCDAEKNARIYVPLISTNCHRRILDPLCSSSNTSPDNYVITQKERCTILPESLFGSIATERLPSSITPYRSPSNNICDIEMAPFPVKNPSKDNLTDKAILEPIYLSSCAKSANENSTLAEIFSADDIERKKNERGFVDRNFMQDNNICDHMPVSGQYPDGKDESILSWNRILPAKFSTNQSNLNINQYGIKRRDLSPMTISPKSSCSEAL